MFKKALKLIFKSKNIKTYILSLTASCVGVGLNFALARILQAEAYGEIQYLVALATTISSFLLFGMSSFLIREAKNEEQNGQALNKCISLLFVIICFAAPIIFYILNNHTAKTEGNTILCLIVITVAFLMSLNNLFISNFHGLGKYHITILFENLLPKLTMLVLLFSFYFLGNVSFFKNHYLLFYIAIYGSVGLACAIKMFKKINLKFSKKELLSIAFFFGVNITYSLSTNVTKVLQGGLFDNPVALGTISISLSIIGLITVFTGVIDALAKPIFAKYRRENNDEKAFMIFRSVTRLSAYISVPFYIFFITSPAHFLGIFGSSYTIYPFILSILAVSNAINSITGPSGTLLAMTGKEKWELLNGTIYIVSYTAFALIFSFDKVYGLCIALVISQIIVNTCKYIEIWKIYKRIPLNLKSVLTILLIALVDFALIFFVRFINNIYIWLAVGITVGIISILLNFVISPYRKSDLKEFLEMSV